MKLAQSSTLRICRVLPRADNSLPKKESQFTSDSESSAGNRDKVPSMAPTTEQRYTYVRWGSCRTTASEKAGRHRTLKRANAGSADNPSPAKCGHLVTVTSARCLHADKSRPTKEPQCDISRLLSARVVAKAASVICGACDKYRCCRCNSGSKSLSLTLMQSSSRDNRRSQACRLPSTSAGCASRSDDAQSPKMF